MFCSSFCSYYWYLVCSQRELIMTEHLLGKALLIVAVPFVLATLYFGSKRGNYYDSDEYKGNGTAH